MGAQMAAAVVLDPSIQMRPLFNANTAISRFWPRHSRNITVCLSFLACVHLWSLPLTNSIWLVQTDEIAHTDEAYEGGQSNPETSKKRIEGEVRSSRSGNAFHRGSDLYFP